MASTFVRGDRTPGKRIYARVKNAKGEWVNEPSPYVVGQPGAEGKGGLADVFAAELQALHDQERVGAAEAASAASRRQTVAAFSRVWIAKRRRRGVVSAGDDEGRLEHHVLPAIGSLLLTEVRPRHIRAIVEKLIEDGTLAPRTIRHVYSVTMALFRGAVAEELLPASPCVLEKHELPMKADADPTWRAKAVFTREEAIKLLFDARILVDRRVLYALKFLAALRHSEAARLRWADVDDTREPFAGLLLTETKTKVPRAVPVHPVLERILDAWRSTGWASVYGRDPLAGDFVTPTRAGTPRDATLAQRQLVEDLATIGLRTRRGHDLRRTFITLARVDGADKDLLRHVTHGVRPGAESDMMDLYTSLPWEVLCAQVRKLRIAVPRESLPVLAAPLAARSANARKRWKKLAPPTGFEAIDGPALPVEDEEIQLFRATDARVGRGSAGGPAARIAARALQFAGGDPARAEAILFQARVLVAGTPAAPPPEPSERGLIALELRDGERLTWREIGRRLGVSTQRAHQLAAEARSRTRGAA